MPTKKVRSSNLHSRHATTREILFAIIFGALVLLFLTLSIINSTSSNQAMKYTYSTSAATLSTIPSLIISRSPTIIVKPTPITQGVWLYTLSCANGKFTYMHSTNGKYVGNYCVDITVNGQPSYSGCGWGGSNGGSGLTDPPFKDSFYKIGNSYTMRGKIWDSSRKVLLVDQSMIRYCGTTNPTGTVMPTRSPSRTPTIYR